jgi:PhnB protein
MVTNVIPYLYFEGNCEEALKFYSSSLKAEIKRMQRVSDGPKEYHRPGVENNIMHAELVIGKAAILASDSMGHKVPAGDNVSLTLNYDDVSEMEAAWKNLSEGAKITMDLQDTFWGAKFGTLKDKFGIHWMFNCDKKA